MDDPSRIGVDGYSSSRSYLRTPLPSNHLPLEWPPTPQPSLPPIGSRHPYDIHDTFVDRHSLSSTISRTPEPLVPPPLHSYRQILGPRQILHDDTSNGSMEWPRSNLDIAPHQMAHVGYHPNPHAPPHIMLDVEASAMEDKDHNPLRAAFLQWQQHVAYAIAKR
jgi:hypothetical protein